MNNTEHKKKYEKTNIYFLYLKIKLFLYIRAMQSFCYVLAKNKKSKMNRK